MSTRTNENVFIIEEIKKKTILDVSQGAAKVL